PKIAIVQAPQDYRDAQESFFKAMCYAEYRGFFSIGMVPRNERNAIIQHGTMTLVRRTALDDAGGWAEWCITEDAELGLRLFEHGRGARWGAMWPPRARRARAAPVRARPGATVPAAQLRPRADAGVVPRLQEA